MKLIVTNDGVYGCDNGRGKGVVWFESAADCCEFGARHKDGWIEEEFSKAVTQCRKSGHDCAEFGVYGTLMFTLDMSEAAA